MTDEDDVPPAVTCPRCGLRECVGCEFRAAERRAPALPWESPSDGWFERLFGTALSTSTEPERVFGELADGSLAPAFAFAGLAEAFAIGSLALGGMTVLAALAPDLALRALADPWALGLLFGAVLAGVVLMVLLHAVWGICLEMGARGTDRGARFTHGVRFGLYACGWDLLTSPAGVVHGLWTRGPVRAWAPILRAILVPSVAMRAYLERCRRLDFSAQRRGRRFSLLVLGTAFLGMSTAIGVLLLRVLAAI